jgi:hypothetical protein
MAVVYRGPHVVVSDDFVEVLESGRRQRYAVGQLRAVNIFLEARGRDARAWRWASILALPAAVAALMVDYRLALALLAIAIAAAVAYAYLRHGRPGRWHLMAVYRGEHRTLFSSTDRREFSQVCRGLRRALERHDDEMAA